MGLEIWDNVGRDSSIFLLHMPSILFSNIHLYHYDILP